MPFAGAEFVLVGGGGGDHRPDTQLHAFGLHQENIEQVQVAFAGAVATVRVRVGTDRRRGAYQLRHANVVVGRNRQGAAYQQVIGMDVGVVVLRGVVVLSAHARGEVQRVVAFVGGLGVIRLGANNRRKQGRQKKGARPRFVQHDSPIPWWLIWMTRHLAAVTA
ncbi:hypothetical protein D3C84_688270 [compost metagenome]